MYGGQNLSYGPMSNFNQYSQSQPNYNQAAQPNINYNQAVQPNINFNQAAQAQAFLQQQYQYSPYVNGMAGQTPTQPQPRNGGKLQNRN